jgi:ribonuclease D
MTHEKSSSRRYGRVDHRGRNHDSAHSDAAPLGEVHPHPLAPAGLATQITTQAGLLELLQTLRKAGSFAYDSEFIGELTYVPRLCLVQVCWADGIALIDPLAADIDVTPFWELLCDPEVTKIVHAGQQDVEPVARLLGRPAQAVFDTQIAAGMVGLPYPVSLAKLVTEVTGAKLGKSLTFCQWDQRPLSAMQVRYAADDVRYLLAVYEHLKKRLEATGHLRWAMAESDAMCQVSEFGFDPESQYRRVRGATSLSPRGLALLKELTIWRDRCAQKHDLPARSFLRDEILVDLAKQPVKSVDKLSRVRGLPRPVEQDYGQQIVELTNASLAAPDGNLPRIKEYEPGPTDRFYADALWAAAQCLAMGQQIDISLITSRQEIGECYRHLAAGESTESMRIGTGWRKEALGDPLAELFHGRRELHARWTDSGLHLQ